MAWVYFLRPIGMDGPVKIGTSKTTERRLAEYQRMSPFLLEEVARVEGSHDTEHRFHSLFAHLRTHHEWFRADPQITRVIELIKEGRFDPSALPRGRTLSRIDLTRSAEDAAERRLFCLVDAYAASGVRINWHVRQHIFSTPDWAAVTRPRKANHKLVWDFLSKHPCPIKAAIDAATTAASVAA